METEKYSTIDIHFATNVHKISQDENTAWAETDQGDIFHGDILIGADGHRSMVRRHVAPDKPDATFAGYMVWIASINRKELPDKDRHRHISPGYTILNSSNGFIFGNAIDKEDGSNDQQIGIAMYDNTRNDLLRTLGCVRENVVHHSLKRPHIPEETLHIFTEEFSKKFSEPWAFVARRAAQTHNITGIPVKEYVPDRLVKKRVAIVGDAAHVPAPITASGVNESLQDVAELGKCVTKNVQNHAAIEALKQYESLRLEKVRQIVLSGQAFSRSFGRI